MIKQLFKEDAPAIVVASVNGRVKDVGLQPSASMMKIVVLFAVSFVFSTVLLSNR